MIAKILASASSDFNGINYNEKKNENGRSELLTACNFDGLSESATKEEYKAYLKSYANKNGRIKNPQFHATLSCKGNEYNMEQMKDFALQWIEQMGYGKQPFLIYAHNDTNNNHVHIVSVRVDANGKKISDHFEKIRSQQALNKIMGIELDKKVKEQYDNFSSYNFTTEKQFELLMEQAGWIVTRNGDNINMIKGGEVQMTVKASEIQSKIENNREKGTDKDRKKQIAAILYKYKVGLNHEELKNLMHQRFGVDMVFHTGKEHTTPYGYTVIDHTSRTVYKGSEILPLTKILQTPEEREKVEAARSVISVIIEGKEKPTLRSVAGEMKKLGYVVDRNGQIKTGENQIVCSVPKETLDALKYNERVEDANLYHVRTKNEAIAISRIYNVQMGDINIQAQKRNLHLVYRYGKLMDDYRMGLDVNDKLNKMKIQVEKVGDTTYFVDKRQHEIYSSRQLNYDRNLIAASKYNAKSDEELKLIAQLYNVRVQDIKPTAKSDDDKEYYSKYMKDYLSGKITNEDLKDKNIFAVNLNNTIYLIDTNHHNIYNEYDFSFGEKFTRNYDVNGSHDRIEDLNESITASIITGVAQLLFESQSAASDVGNGRAKDLREKKKKKKKQFKI